MNTAVGIMERRVNGLGVQEAEVQTQGDKNIIVNIPKGTNSAQAREQVGTTAKLYFRPVLTGAPRAMRRHPAPLLPSPSPSGKSPSPSASGKSPSPTPTATTQGRAVTEGLAAKDGAKKADPTPSAPPSGSAPPPADPSGEAAAADVQKQLDALNCSTAKGRAAASERPARPRTRNDRRLRIRIPSAEVRRSVRSP